MYSDKVTKSVADAVKTVTEQVKPEMLNEELKGNQHKIDANKNNKIDAHDFKLLRAKKNVEESAYHDKDWVEKSERHERLYDYHKRMGNDAEAAKHKAEIDKLYKKEEVEQIGEAKYEPAEPDAEAIAKRKAREEAQRRREEKAERDADDLSKDYKPKTQASGVKKVAGKAYGGSAQKDETNESVKSFSGLLESFMTGGIKSLFENLQTVEEEASEEEFNAELKKQKDKAEGKAPQADVAAAATQGTKDMKEEVEDLEESTYDYKKAMKSDNPRIQKKGIGGAMDAAVKRIKQTIKDVPLNSLEKTYKEEVEDLEERTLTSAETAEKERIVKGMKKGVEGFKQRYGERAKEVMYATATKQAKED